MSKEIYEIKLRMKETDKINLEDHYWLNNPKGIQDEIISWLEDLGFEIQELHIKGENRSSKSVGYYRSNTETIWNCKGERISVKNTNKKQGS